jgi:hypothetical protein
MSDAEILIRCPGCGTAHRVTMAVGQQLRCTTCQTVFSAPVLDPSSLTLLDPTAAATPAGSGAGPELGTAGNATGVAVGETAAFAPAQGVPQVPQIAAGKERRRRESWREDENTPRPTPAAAPAPAPPAESGVLWNLVALVALVCIVVSGSILGIYVVRRWDGAPGGSERLTPPATTQPGAAAPSAHRWTDAVRGAQQLGKLETQVVRAKYGAVRAKDLNNEVITTDDTNLLAITVAVHNRGSQAHAFQSWYAGTTSQEGAAELLPELSDDAGRVYALLRFEDVSSIEGQRLADTIEPHQQVQDTVVFLVPEGIDRKQIRYLRLALPADALGTSGWFRFEIPASMVRGLVDAPPSAEPSAPAEEADGTSTEEPAGTSAKEPDA